MFSHIEGKKVLVGISGSIAAYKSCELIRKLVSAGSEVFVMVTRHALEFVTPLTLETLSGHPVIKDLYDEKEFSGIHHVSVAHWADVVLVAPATANIIAKAACGLADDIVSTVILSTKAPIIFAPAMNDQMYENKIFQRNLQTLVHSGYHIADSEKGYLACGYEGVGRLTNIENILSLVNDVIKK